MYLVQSLHCLVLVSGEIGIHELEDEFRWVDLSWHGEAGGSELSADLTDGAEVVRFAAREKQEFIEELKCGS